MCVMVKGSPLETPQPEWWSTCLCAFFLPVKREGKMGVREWGGGGGQERLFSFGIWILGHAGPGVSQSGQSEKWRGVGGGVGLGVLGGLIRRMLSHHPSRQAAENWLAPRRVEFTGGGVGGGG